MGEAMCSLHGREGRVGIPPTPYPYSTTRTTQQHNDDTTTRDETTTRRRDVRELGPTGIEHLSNAE